MGLGPTELVIILVLVIIFFGAKRLPALASSIGQSVRELKKGLGGEASDSPAESSRKDAPPAAPLPAAIGTPPAPPTVSDKNGPDKV